MFLTTIPSRAHPSNATPPIWRCHPYIRCACLPSRHFEGWVASCDPPSPLKPCKAFCKMKIKTSSFWLNTGSFDFLPPLGLTRLSEECGDHAWLPQPAEHSWDAALCGWPSGQCADMGVPNECCRIGNCQGRGCQHSTTFPKLGTWGICVPYILATAFH